jgi:excisionase family DNA binding protein
VKRKEGADHALLTTADVARIFEVHPGTIRRWCEGGKIKSYRSGPQQNRRFLREDVAVAYLDRGIQKYFQIQTNHH